MSDLLLLSRLDTQVPSAQTPCRLQDIPSDIEEELAALAIANDVHLILDQPQSPAIAVKGNENHLYRLVFNIVSNALQHTPAGGKVSIRLQQAVRKTFPDGEKHQAVVTVEDTGVGIAPQQTRPKSSIASIELRKIARIRAVAPGWDYRSRWRSPKPTAAIFRFRVSPERAVCLRSRYRCQFRKTS